MDVTVKFPLLRPLAVTDCWPLEGYGAELEFERSGGNVIAIRVTFKNQPIELAPRISQTSEEVTKTNINFRGGYEASAKNIIRRFSEYINLYFSIQVNTADFETSFIPTTAEEKKALQVFSFKASKSRKELPIKFSMLAQAFFAGESSDDPSFVAYFSRIARESFLAEQYIDAFRYCFLLFESLYGEGKFKTKQLLSKMTSSQDFVRIVTGSIEDFRDDPMHSGSGVKNLIAMYSNAELMIGHLIEQRGFYFHGNLMRPDAWHPERQDGVKDIAEFSVNVAASIASSFASAMFTDVVTQRHFDNAKKQGAILQIDVKFKLIDEHGFEQFRTLRINTPGTVFTNELLLSVNKNFLEWAETELFSETLISFSAHKTDDDIMLFRGQYFPQHAAGNDKNKKTMICKSLTK